MQAVSVTTKFSRTGGSMSSKITQESNNFGSRFGALMSMTGMCVGMGSVWRFPWMVGQYGGGSFIIAYIVCTILITLPLAIMECGVGKGLQKGMMGAYTEILHNKKAGSIVGLIGALGYFTMNFFYYVVLAASTYFIYASATSEWNRCAPELIYTNYSYNKTLVTILSVILVAATIYVLLKGVSGGIEKLSKIIIPMMFLFFIAVIFLGIFCIDDIGVGYNWYLKPNLKALMDPEIWIAALSQSLFAVGVGPGCILVYGSHLKKTDDVTLNMTTVCFMTCAVGIIVGMAMMPACIAMGLDPESGSMLIYVIIPTLLSWIPFGNIVGVLLFIAILFAGFSTAIAQTEVAASTFATDLRLGRRKACLLLGGINLIAAVAAVYSVAFYDFWNSFSGNYVFVVMAGVGAIAFVYIYKVDRIRINFLNISSDIQLGSWFSKFVTFIAAPLMIIVMINSLLQFIPSGHSFTNDMREKGLAGSAAVMLVIILIFFAITAFLLYKCMTVKPHEELSEADSN